MVGGGGCVCLGGFGFDDSCDTCLGFLEVVSSRLCCFNKDGESILLFLVCFDFVAPDSELEDVADEEDDFVCAGFLGVDLGFGTGGQMYRR